MILFFLFFKDRSSLLYFITQGMGQSLCSLPYTLYQGLIQDFLLGGETVFLKKFWIFSDSRTAEFSYNNFSNSIVRN